MIYGGISFRFVHTKGFPEKQQERCLSVPQQADDLVCKQVHQSEGDETDTETRPVTESPPPNTSNPL